MLPNRTGESTVSVKPARKLTGRQFAPLEAALAQLLQGRQIGWCCDAKAGGLSHDMSARQPHPEITAMAPAPMQITTANSDRVIGMDSGGFSG